MHELILLCASLIPHDGPDPIGSWRLGGDEIEERTLHAVLGVDGRLEGEFELVGDAAGDALYFDGRTTRVVLADDFRATRQALPTQHMTVEAWVAIESPQAWGGMLGVLQDNGGAEQGWILGYDTEVFTFGLASAGADDGDGLISYVRGTTRYEAGRFYHVVATYDGEEQRLYVNGALEATSRAQSGALLYPAHAPLVIGGYADDDESYFHHGRIRSVRLFDKAAEAEWVGHAFEHLAELAAAEPHVWIDPEHRWVVEPYLQWATRDGMTVRWETSRPSSSTVHFGEAVQWTGEDEERTGALPERRDVEKLVLMHEVRLDGLRADTAHYYRVESTDDLGRTLTSPFLSFQTACEEDTPFAFCVISDTQSNPTVSGRIAALAWANRPSFVLHPGDLVGTGGNKHEWIDEFFGSMKPLFERVALFPVLGNHEQDARWYYDYMSLPDPEYHYTFAYGNAQFFMLDSNREVGPGSRQYEWLAAELAASRATWKIVCYHHPSYTSDENDYGDVWSGPSTRGDVRVQALVPLYDEHGVDIVWNGHIHSYERTWPLRGGKATRPGRGTVYMITGGGGGSLETPGPIRPWFQNNVRHGHHYCLVAVNGRTLEMKAFDDEGRLFDHWVVEKAR